MSEQVTHDVNEYLGSWGAQPSDHYEPPRAVEASTLLTVDDWYELARRWEGYALEAIADGRAEDAAHYTRGAYRFCLEFQLAGGKPWA